DDRLCLWIDDDLVDFGQAAAFQHFDAGTPRALESDLAPVGIAAKSCQAQLSDLTIDRDIYYRKTFEESDRGDNRRLEGEIIELHQLLHDPEAWSRAYAQHGEFMSQRDYKLGPDEFLAL